MLVTSLYVLVRSCNFANAIEAISICLFYSCGTGIEITGSLIHIKNSHGKMYWIVTTLRTMLTGQDAFEYVVNMRDEYAAGVLAG